MILYIVILLLFCQIPLSTKQISQQWLDVSYPEVCCRVRLHDGSRVLDQLAHVLAHVTTMEHDGVGRLLI